MTEDIPALAPGLVGNMGRHALYRFYSDQGELLYVGTSGDFGRRFSVHAQKIWFLQVRGITLEWYASEADALKAERRAIHVEHPKYNVQHRETRTLNSTPPRPRSPRLSVRAGRDMAAVLIGRYPNLTNAEIAQKAGVHPRTVQRARNGLDQTPAPPINSPAPRTGGRARAADIIRRNPGWDNAQVAAQAGCDVRTVRRARNDLAGREPS